MSQTQAIVGRTWEAVGPFPSGMREHPLTASPLAASVHDPSTDPDIEFARKPFDSEETWPSELVTGGQAGWQRFETKEDGWLEITYPDVRWDQLRADHGWAALQYQSVLRTTLTIPELQGRSLTPVRIDLVQGVEFALIPSASQSASESGLFGPTQWYAGDIYDFADSPSGQRDLGSRTSNFARSLAVAPGEYTLLVRAIYEIRMFGDPGLGNAPVIRLKFQIELDDCADEPGILVNGTGVVPDGIEGWLMGDWMSVGLRVPADQEEVVVLSAESDLSSTLNIQLGRPARIQPGQTRPVALHITQHAPLAPCVKSLAIRFKLSVKGRESILTWHPSIKEHSSFTDQPFRITFASSSLSDPLSPPARVAQAMIVPPPTNTAPPQSASEARNGGTSPVLLMLHGAGVDFSGSELSNAIPRVLGHWAVLPEGGNEWGEDWHGGSMQEVWAARQAINPLLGKVGVTVSDQTILMGHSNGGQGAWHLAARYPDKIVGSAGYLSIQHYVPYTELTSNHYADPALLGILHSSLTPYQNDLYASNLSHLPILVIHGADDDNVPPRHSRAHLALIAAWAGTSDNLTFVEIPEHGHWWDDIVKSEHVTRFIENLPQGQSWDEQRQKGFTLTTANPQESGGRAGIRIVELDTPGRLARLDVNARQWRGENPAKPLDLRGTNIKRIELIASSAGGEVETFTKHKGDWQAAIPHPTAPPRAYGPMIRFLSSSSRISIVIPAQPGDQHASIAKRIAHDLYLYHRLDSEIIIGQTALERTANQELGDGDVLVIGRPEENRFADWMIKQKHVPLFFPTKGVMLLDDKVVYDQGAGIITLHPHPTSDKALSILIAGNDNLGLELAARLFPIRTGVPVPDWAVVSPRSRWQAAGGLIGAGFWGADWGWNEAMSWTDR